MTTYSYSLKKDFLQANEINDVAFIIDLQQTEIATPLAGIEVIDDVVNLKFDYELTKQELSLLLEVIHNHQPTEIEIDRNVLLSDEKSSGCHGGDVEGGIWLTRDLNKLSTSKSMSWISVNTNIITLKRGYYFLYGSTSV